MFGGSGNLCFTTAADTASTPPRPPPPPSTLLHRPFAQTHVCTRSNPILALHLCVWHHVNVWKMCCSYTSAWANDSYLFSKCRSSQLIGKLPHLWTPKESDSLLLGCTAGCFAVGCAGGQIKLADWEIIVCCLYCLKELKKESFCRYTKCCECFDPWTCELL